LHQYIPQELADQELQHIDRATSVPAVELQGQIFLSVTVPLHYTITNTFHSLSLGFLGYDCVYFSFET
jgi:hypothetical protein